MYIVKIFLITFFLVSSTTGELMSLKPYFARITYKINENELEQVGSIITDRFVLTTGDSTGVEHSIYVHVGAKSQIKLAANFWHRLITSLTQGPGLIQLSKPLTFSSKIQPIRLPPANEILELPNVQGIIGSKDNLHESFLRVTNQTICSLNYPNHPTFSFFCAARDNQSDFCINDRGTGFEVVSRGREYLLGIAIENSCNSQRPSLFIRVSFYRRRILNIINEIIDNLKDYRT